MKNIKLQLQVDQQTAYKVSTKKTTSRHRLAIFLKTNDKGKILKSSQKEKISHKGTMIQIITDFSTETMETETMEQYH